MPRKKRNDVAVKIDAEVVRKAKTITSYRGEHLAEYFSRILKPVVERDFEQFKKQLGKDGSG